MRMTTALFAAILIALTVAACAGQPKHDATAPAAGTESQAQAPTAPEGQAAPADAPAAPSEAGMAPAAEGQPAEAAPQN